MDKMAQTVTGDDSPGNCKPPELSPPEAETDCEGTDAVVSKVDALVAVIRTLDWTELTLVYDKTEEMVAKDLSLELSALAGHTQIQWYDLSETLDNRTAFSGEEDNQLRDLLNKLYTQRSGKMRMASEFDARSGKKTALSMVSRWLLVLPPVVATFLENCDLELDNVAVIIPPAATYRVIRNVTQWPALVERDGNGGYTGLCIELITQLTASLNFRLVPPDGWEVDLVVAPLAIQAEREMVMDFIHPYYLDYDTVLLKLPDPDESKWRRLIQLFKPHDDTLLFCSSNLIAFLAVTKDEAPFQTLEGLVEQDYYYWGTTGGAFTVTVFQRSSIPVFKKVWAGITESLKSDPDVLALDVHKHLEKVKAGGYAYIGETSLMSVWLKSECDLLTIKEQFLPMQYAVGLPNNSAYTRMFSDVMLKINDVGLTETWLRKWIGTTTSCQDQGSKIKEAKPVDLLDIQSAFYISSIGITVALLVLGVEMDTFEEGVLQDKFQAVVKVPQDNHLKAAVGLQDNYSQVAMDNYPLVATALQDKFPAVAWGFGMVLGFVSWVRFSRDSRVPGSVLNRVWIPQR
nr:hypothetical protein BaRGS_014996 [Batillaria attramentaria]